MAGEEDEEQDGEGKDIKEDSEGAGLFARKWGWIANVDAVAETLRCSWDAVWEMSVTEFLNILCYRRDKLEHEKQEQEKWIRSH